MKKVLECLTVFFLTVIFCLWMVSMTTRSWRGNPNFKPPIPGLTIAPYDVHHGLWYRCVKPDGTCEKLKDDPNDTTDTSKWDIRECKNSHYMTGLSFHIGVILKMQIFCFKEMNTTVEFPQLSFYWPHSSALSDKALRDQSDRFLPSDENVNLQVWSVFCLFDKAPWILKLFRQKWLMIRLYC